MVLSCPVTGTGSSELFGTMTWSPASSPTRVASPVPKPPWPEAKGIISGKIQGWAEYGIWSRGYRGCVRCLRLNDEFGRNPLRRNSFNARTTTS